MQWIEKNIFKSDFRFDTFPKFECALVILYPTFKLNKVIVVTYEIRVFFEGVQKEVFSSIFKKTL